MSHKNQRYAYIQTLMSPIFVNIAYLYYKKTFSDSIKV